jgi:hypothetical protein
VEDYIVTTWKVLSVTITTYVLLSVQARIKSSGRGKDDGEEDNNVGGFEFFGCMHIFDRDDTTYRAIYSEREQ